MLVLNRTHHESILIGDDIRVTVVEVAGGGVRIGIEAPAVYRSFGKRSVAKWALLHGLKRLLCKQQPRTLTNLYCRFAHNRGSVQSISPARFEFTLLHQGRPCFRAE